MIKQLKLGFGMMRYTFGVKMCLVLGIIFFAIGIVMEFLAPPASVSGAMFLMVCGMWPAQLVYSLGVSDVIKTSKHAKAMETSIPTLICFVTFLVCYIIIVLFKLPHLSGATEEMMGYMVSELMMSSILAAVLMFFCGIAYKLFILASIIFLVAFCSLTTISEFGTMLSPDISFGTAVIVGFAIVVAGALLQYGVSLLVYKVPLSKKAQLRGLQKYM